MTNPMTQQLAERITQTLDYVRIELEPKYMDAPISSHAGGITPNDLIALVTMIQAQRKALEFYAEASTGELRMDDGNYAIELNRLYAPIAALKVDGDI